MRRTCAVIIVGMFLPCSLPAAEFHVSPDGKDGSSGTRSQPLATFAGARDAVRAFCRTHPNEEVTVWVAGGTYRLTETLVFSLEDSGGQGQTITYAAAPGKRPVLSGAAPVRGWTKLQVPPPGLPEAARGKVWVADVAWVREIKQRQSRSPGVAAQFDRSWRFFTLYQGDRSLPRARGPAFTQIGATQFRRENLQELNTNCQTLRFPLGAVKNYSRLTDAELVVIPMYPWIMNILPIQSIDVEQGALRTAVPATYPLGRSTIGLHDTAYIENVLEVLDEPGEWVLDSQDAKLYLWPQGERPGDDLAVPVLTELLRIEGQIDYAGPQDTPVRNLVFRGLTFTQGDRFCWHGRTGWGLQHDWEMFDSPSALVRFRGTDGCTLEQCRFVNAGGSGVRLDLHAQNNRVRDNEFAELGGVGILLAGYGPGTKDVNRRNEIANNHVHHIGRLYWGSPAIIAWQSGHNRIVHNTIHHTPYDGICVIGRQDWHPRGDGECARTIRRAEVELPDHVNLETSFGQTAIHRAWDWQGREPFLHARNNRIERNDIHHVMQRLGDGNAIYFSGAGGSNLVRENYVHDCDGPEMNAALRCDGDQHGVTFERNIVFRTGGFAEGIVSKGQNHVLGNIVADLRPTHPRQRHRGYLVFSSATDRDPPTGSTIRRNVFFSARRGQIVCDRPADLRRTAADYNLYFSTADPDWGRRHLDQQQPFGIETHSRAADPLFVDLEHGDFRFRPESPALKLGIEQPFDVRQAGVQERDPEQSLDIYFLDMVGGASTLIVTPPGESVLIDTGSLRPEHRDADRILRACQDAGLKQIDFLVTTHFHSDHFGAILEVSQRIPVKRFMDKGTYAPAGDGDSRWSKDLYALYEQATKGNVTAIRAGDDIPLRNDPAGKMPPIRLHCVAAEKKVEGFDGDVDAPGEGVRMEKPDHTDNARSIALLLTCGRFKFFAGGDITQNVEYHLVHPIDRIGKVDLYQVTHHGLDLSNNTLLLKALDPTVAVAMNGPRKGIQPRTFQALDALPGLQTLYQIHYNTEHDGRYNTKPEFIANRKDSPNRGELIKASVRADKGTFTVQIGPDGERRTYKVQGYSQVRVPDR